jgi:hypothetical protein
MKREQNDIPQAVYRWLTAVKNIASVGVLLVVLDTSMHSTQFER